MLRRACTNSGISFPLYAKFLGTPCFNVTVLLPNFRVLGVPDVMKQAFIGTCVENPNLLAAVSPVGNTIALSLLQSPLPVQKQKDIPLQIVFFFALTYTPLAIRVIKPSFSN